MPDFAYTLKISSSVNVKIHVPLTNQSLLGMSSLFDGLSEQATGTNLMVLSHFTIINICRKILQAILQLSK